MTEQQMRVFNERIGETERTLEWLYEQRREFINRHNLNKPCDHIMHRVGGYYQCVKCDERKDITKTFRHG